jgi:hypothetical protein
MAYNDLQAEYDKLKKEFTAVQGSEASIPAEPEAIASSTKPLLQAITTTPMTAVGNIVHEDVRMNVNVLWAMVEAGWGS